MIKKGLKYLLITISALLVLTILLLLLTQTLWFKAKVADRINKLVTNEINGQFSIEEITGNFYRYVELQNVMLTNNDSTIASFSGIKLHYNLWALLKKQIEIDSVIVINPTFSVSQLNDSTWNFQTIVPQKEKRKKNAANLFAPTIDLKHLEIINGNVSVSSSNQILPTSINKINTSFTGNYNAKKIDAHLKEFSFQSQNPEFYVREISSYFKLDESGIAIDSFKLHTSGSNVFMNGLFKSVEDLNAEIKTIPLDKNELAIFVPSIKLAFSPELIADFKSQNDSTLANVEIRNGKQSVKIAASLVSLSKVLNGEKEQIPFQAHLNLNNVIPEDWLVMNSSNSILNGALTLSGKDLFNLKSAIKVNANLANSVYLEQSFKKLQLNGIYENGKLETAIDVESEKVDFTAEGKIINITSEKPEYNFSLITDSLNLSSLIPKVEGTFLNANMTLKGVGLSDSLIQIGGTIQLKNSSIYYIPVDSANLKFHLADLKIILDTIDAQIPGGNLKGSGLFDIQDLYLSVKAVTNVDTLEVINHYVTLPIDFKNVNVDAIIEGPVSNLVLTGEAIAKNASGYSLEIDSLQGSILCLIKKDSLHVGTKFNAVNLTSGPVVWDTLSGNINYNKNQIEAAINANWQDTVKAKIRTNILLGDSLHIAVPQFEVQTIIADYYLQDTLQSVDIQPNSIDFNKIWIKDKMQPNFNLKLNGLLAVDKQEDIQIEIEELNLNQLNRIIPLEDSIHGVLSTTMSIVGTPKNPILKGNLNITNPGYKTMYLSNISADLSYENKFGNMNFSIPEVGSIGSVSAPMELFYDSTGFVVKPPETFDAALKIDQLSISQEHSNIISGIDIAGNLDLDIKANGTIKNPQFYGHFKFDSGHFKHQGLGISYDNIISKIAFEGAKVIVDSLLIKQEKGFLSANGEIEFDSTIITGNVINSTLVADADNFNVIRNQEYKLLVDANTFVKMGKNYPEFGGQVNVIQSEFFIPKLRGIERENENEDDSPLLLQAINNIGDSAQVNLSTDAEKDKNEQISDFRKNLTGRIKLIIPRNTWIKSDEMNLELRGEMDLVKTGPNFELFGNIIVNRGHYILYGRKLVMKESEIIFQGGVDFDPTLNIIAEYTFRDSQKTKRELALTVSGLLSDPSINFTLDGNVLTESEAVSVLVFGKTPDEMDTGGQNGLVGSVGSNMVAQILTSQLNKNLGSALNLDLIEITATENWQSAAFVVGKYITNDLFMTYQRGFGETEDDEITPETLTLEYELNRIFFLHLKSGNSKDSGLDVILKFEQKLKD